MSRLRAAWRALTQPPPDQSAVHSVDTPRADDVDVEWAASCWPERTSPHDPHDLALSLIAAIMHGEADTVALLKEVCAEPLAVVRLATLAMHLIVVLDGGVEPAEALREFALRFAVQRAARGDEGAGG